MKKAKQSKKKEPASSEPQSPTVELDPIQQYNVETAWKELGRALGIAEQPGRRAKAQEHLREALMWITKTPVEFTDKEFNEQYYKLYNKLYRGY